MKSASRQRGERSNAGHSRPLKVLHVGKFYPPHVGGIETHLAVLAGELSKKVDLRVVVASDNHKDVRETVDGVRVSRVATWFTAASAPICPGMIREFRRSDADIVHLHFPNPTAVLAYLASRCRGRLVITYHSDAVRQKILGHLFAPCVQAALCRSSAIITSSTGYRSTSEALSRHLDRCHVIPYGIPLSQFQYSDSAAVREVRQQYGERLVLSVGRLVYYKGFENLVRAMTRVDGTLMIVGEGPLRGKLEQLTRDLGIATRVKFVGGVPDVVPYYHAADLFALASNARSETFGIVQIEAMAAGRPVVNTNLDTGVPLVSLHDQTGFTVAANDPIALGEAIGTLLNDPELRRAFGHAARIRAQQEFSLDLMVRRTLSLYKAVLAERDPEEYVIANGQAHNDL